MSDDGSKEEAEPQETAKIRIALKAMWDASLTYDLLDDPSDDPEDDQGPVFVGRTEFLGALVNAIGQPDRRGTYLVSGYRGVGKTSLIIQATRLARARLQAEGWRLLPVVLNVSEVSASLDPLSTVERSPLQIDARRLLTALLRALRNRVPMRTTAKRDGMDALAEKIQWAYQKAEATKYTETEQQRAESVDTTARESKRIINVADVLKLVAVVALLGAAAAEGVALLGSVINQLHVIAIALAGVAIFSFQRSVTITRKSTQALSASSELVRDNSVHQLESELKDILERLYKEKRRTVIILEELDKIDDQQGGQLDSVIRYFKNLFTQAPALFFFVTDKNYYDLIAKKIELARSQRSYAIEHTFFTHRLFVSRPNIEECLQYMMAALLVPDDSQQVEVIAKAQGNRIRSLEEMSSTEQFIRVLLFRSQGHFFDLKNEMRQFVRVNPTGSWLESDEGMMPKSERALAAFQFLVDQKMLSYRFGGSNDYANEELRNYLFSVFESLGSSELQQIAHFYPVLGSDGDPLTLDERRRITEAVGSLIEDLERGGAIKQLPPDPSTVENGQPDGRFTWKEQAAVSFVPIVRAEAHEEVLFADLSRIAAWADTLSQHGLLWHPGDSTTSTQALSVRLAQQVQTMKRSPTAIPIEDSVLLRREAEKAIAPFLELAVSTHLQRLTGIYQLDLISTSKKTPPNTFVLSQGNSSAMYSVLLVYEFFDHAEGDEIQLPRPSAESELLAVVDVVLDEPIMTSPQLSVEAPASKLIPKEVDKNPFLVTVPFYENLGAEAVADQWGERTADELRFAQLWCRSEIWRKSDIPRTTEPAGPYVLLTSDETQREMPSLSDAFNAWLETDDSVLAWAPDSGPWSYIIGQPSPIADEQLTAALGNQSKIVVSPYTTFTPERGVMTDQEAASAERLHAAGRTVYRLQNNYAGWGGQDQLLKLSSRGRVLLETPDLDWLPPGPGAPGVSVVYLQNPQIDLVNVARLVQGHYRRHAVSLLQESAQAGKARPMAELVRLLADNDPEEARTWRTQLAASGDADAMLEAAQSIEGNHADDAAELYRKAAEAGNARGMSRLVILLADRDPEEARTWRTQLAASGDANAILAAARSISDNHADDAAALYRKLAEAGNARGMSRLVRLLADRDPEEARTWRTRLADSGEQYEIWDTAQAIEGNHPSDAAELYRKLAEAGDTDATVELVSLLADNDAEEARTWRTRLAESGIQYQIRKAAGRIERDHPDDAAELYRKLAEAGDTDAMSKLVSLLADRDPEEARTWKMQLEKSQDSENG
jgi:hypothetical protein